MNNEKYYEKLGKIYLEMSDLIRRANNLYECREFLIDEFINEERNYILKRLSKLKYQLKELGIENNFKLKGEFWDEKNKN